MHYLHGIGYSMQYAPICDRNTLSTITVRNAIDGHIGYTILTLDERSVSAAPPYTVHGNRG